MTREEIKDFCDMKIQLEPENEDIFKAIIEALEQEPIFDKIRDEIEQFADTHCSGDDINIYDVFQIIDKYQAESEG